MLSDDFLPREGQGHKGSFEESAVTDVTDISTMHNK